MYLLLLNRQPIDHADSREVTMNRESWLPPYTLEEQNRELQTRSRVLRWRAKRALHQNQKLREHASQLLKKLRAFSPAGTLSPHSSEAAGKVQRAS